MKEIGKASKLLQILVVFTLLFSNRAFAKFSTDTDWKSVKTEHFKISYPVSYQRFTESLAQCLEEAYAFLSKDLHWTLESRADIVVNGDTDFANGLTTVFPLNSITFNAVPFSPASSLGEYDNWIRTLAYHELTHLIANDTTRGIFAFARTFIGSAAKMNQYQPPWIIEGLAVHEETLRSQYGRGRSVWVDSLIRAAVKDGMLNRGSSLYGVTLDRLSDGPPIWPGPLAPYFYGYVMEEVLDQTGGENALGRVSYLNAGTLPFFLDYVSEEVASQSYQQLWDKAVEKLTTIAQADLAEIRKQPVTEPKFFSSSGRSSGAGAFTDPSIFYYSRDSYATGTGLSRVNVQTGHEEVVSDWYYGGETSVKAKNSWVLYSRYELFQEYQQFLDVFLWDAKRGKEFRVTEGARARDPEFSPDFDWSDEKITRGSIAYIKNQTDANQALVIFDGKKEQVLVQGKDFERLSAPAWNPVNPAWIVLSIKPNGGRERLAAVNVRTFEIRMITQATGLRVSELTSSWSATGELLFASSVDGVYNIYKIPADQVLSGIAHPEKITQLETGALYPVILGGKLYASTYHSNGYDIAELPMSHAEELLPRIASLYDKIRSEKISEKETGEPIEAPVAPSLMPEDSSPFPALWPKYVLPYGQKVVDGVILGVQTSGFDVTQIHSYSLSAGYDSRATFPVYDVVYKYDGLYPSLQIERNQQNYYVGYNAAISNAVVTTQFKIIYPFGLSSLTFGATYLASAYIGQSASSGGLQLAYSYSDNEIFPNAIDQSGGDRGFSANLTATAYVLGSDQFGAFEGRVEERIPFLFAESFFRVSATGAYSGNQFLDSNFYLGGGESNIAYLQDYMIRGYEPGVILGRDITTFNFEYWFPIADVFRGYQTFPVFFQRTKVKLFVDTGSAELVAKQSGSFVYWPTGTGVQILQDVSLLFRLPVTLAAGFDWGLNPSLGGEKQFVVGLYGKFD